MPAICCLHKCNGDYPKGKKVRVFKFPDNEDLKAKWVVSIHREEFFPTKFSRVCELHFEPSQIVREASAYDPRTGRTLTAPLSFPRLREGAVPTLFLPPPDSRVESKRANRKKQSQTTEEIDGSELAKLLKIGTGIETQNVAEPSIVIKQESVESIDERPPLVSDNISSPKDMVPSSSSSTDPNSLLPAISSPLFIKLSPFPENVLPVANSDSTSQDETGESNKHKTKRKINDVIPDASVYTTSTSQPKLRRLAKPPKPSKRSNMPHPPSGTKKSAARSIPLSADTQNATRETFESLLNGSENNPMFGSASRERPGDLFDVFADFIAEKLREMDWDKCAFALRSILDIVFKTGQVQQSSEEEDSDISDTGSGSSSSSHSDQE